MEKEKKLEAEYYTTYEFLIDDKVALRYEEDGWKAYLKDEDGFILDTEPIDIEYLDNSEILIGNLITINKELFEEFKEIIKKEGGI